MAKRAKARIILVKMVSTAGTGYFFPRAKPRLAPKLAMMKHDPKVNKHVLFTEEKMK
ncbi:50S ribosomal protein L33 [Piptocephalis cylindrospora]|uniref:Large ribosomal subunit protein bL33m n=1 Tax=Piptocephalis cylindrospora TaxID=1907219 RepID=A0A4P9XZN2_9FUNG|nr:50S ribosomal protein L33 [Piptocephalis cylindrospora]|eukprot:RKP11905.1 50S ribosomal protein L33 [Piptocephalis cylindrospora]